MGERDWWSTGGYGGREDGGRTGGMAEDLRSTVRYRVNGWGSTRGKGVMTEGCSGK